MKVALSGLGGDEMFAGYSSFRTVPRMERFARRWAHVPPALRVLLAGAFAQLAAKTDQNRKLAELARQNGSLIHPYFLSRMLFAPHQRESLLSARNEPVMENANATLRYSVSRAQALDPINRGSYLEARCYVLNTLLRDADCVSMAHGLEVRVPFHRPPVGFTIPGSWELNGAIPKPLLTGALKGALPAGVVWRPKQGFTLPFERWLKDELRGGVDAVIQKVRHGPLASVLDSRAADGVWTDFLRGKTSWSRPWAIYVLQRWCELQL